MSAGIATRALDHVLGYKGELVAGANCLCSQKAVHEALWRFYFLCSGIEPVITNVPTSPVHPAGLLPRVPEQAVHYSEELLVLLRCGTRLPSLQQKEYIRVTAPMQAERTPCTHQEYNQRSILGYSRAS